MACPSRQSYSREWAGGPAFPPGPTLFVCSGGWRVDDGDYQCTPGTKVISGAGKHPERETTVISHPSKTEGRGTRL